MSASKATQAATPTASGLSNIRGSFEEQVIRRIQIATNSGVYNYSSYLARPLETRTNDEANAVDLQFTRYTLEWLGFGSGDWIYNVPQNGQKQNRPDYLVKASIGAAFVWEDKNSSVDLAEEHLRQMRRYSVGTPGYAVWSNMRRIVAIRFVSADTLKYEILADVSVEALFGPQPCLPELEAAHVDNLALLRLLFGKERFTRFTDLANKIAVDEATFELNAVALNTPEALKNFISGSRQSLDHLRLAALSVVRKAVQQQEETTQADTQLRLEWDVAERDFVDRLGYEVIRQPVQAALARLRPRLGTIDSHEIGKLKDTLSHAAKAGTGRVEAAILTYYEEWLERASHINSALLTLRFQADEASRVAEAFKVWSERQSEAPDANIERFAEQVGYVFFIRLLLVRILEDKQVLKPRLASDGGFREWTQYVQRHFSELQGVGLLNESYYDLLNRKAGHFYLHFFQQAVFDWFTPDDFLLVETLEFLCRYNFRNVQSDIIGFTYEEYITRTTRNRRGHFLTRDEVVEYMLDILGYHGPDILGRRILDPAVGSGSFLVHAARRYRQALIASMCRTYSTTENTLLAGTLPDARRELARLFLDALTSQFFGLEINPFSCYLAEMNLLIQGLDDLQVLQAGPEVYAIERFQIFSTNSLSLPREVLNSDDTGARYDLMSIPDRLSDRLTDEAYPLKARLDEHNAGFFYIISNPPYVSSKQVELEGERYRSAPFFKPVLTGDTNLYLLFLRLGLYYLADSGRMVFIVPLTLLGDESAAGVRSLLANSPFQLEAITRFYRGDVLFPGVDQAVAVVKVARKAAKSMVDVAGGATINEARIATIAVSKASVADAAPRQEGWRGEWLVSPLATSYPIWLHVRNISGDGTSRLGKLLDDTFERKQGDVNATAINPFRLGKVAVQERQSALAIYKGENVSPFAPLPLEPSDWVNPSLATQGEGVRQVLRDLMQLTSPQQGIVMREVARLNTRRRLTATWFERNAANTFAFTHETWRMVMKPNISEIQAKALLALLSSKVVSYLVNLFSSNNHVVKGDLSRVPTPQAIPLPAADLAQHADDMLQRRERIMTDYEDRYGVSIEDAGTGESYTAHIPPTRIASELKLPTVTLHNLALQGRIRLPAATARSVGYLWKQNALTVVNNEPELREVLDIFCTDSQLSASKLDDAVAWQLPEPSASQRWLETFQTIRQGLSQDLQQLAEWQDEIDEITCTWYGFDSSAKSAILAGLPWARRE